MLIGSKCNLNHKFELAWGFQIGIVGHILYNHFLSLLEILDTVPDQIN